MHLIPPIQLHLALVLRNMPVFTANYTVFVCVGHILHNPVKNHQIIAEIIK